MYDQKASAFIASFSAQIGAVGVLLLVPLIYQDVLPVFKLPMLVPLTLSAPPPPERVGTKTAAQSTRPSTAPPVYRLPTITYPLSSVASSSGAYVDAPPVASLEGPFEPGVPLIPQVRLPPPSPRPTPVIIKDPPPPVQQVQVGGDVQSAKIINRVIPAYPAMARQARISGTVRLLGVIAKDGTVQKLQVVSGHPYLVQAALAAVRQWVYRPTLLNGEPVEVIAPIDVIFTLQ